MSRRKEPEPLFKATMNVFLADKEWFEANYPRAGWSKAARYALRKFRETVEAAKASAGPELVLELELDDELEGEDAGA